jgi:circadian clock protein KaiC
MEQLSPDYGGDRRRLRIQKLRGAAFRSGYHDLSIVRGGVRVFPRLVAAEHHVAFERTQLASGVAGLDGLVGGGIERGTSTLLLGGAGTGKSSIVAQYAAAAATRGERSLIFAFDELRATSIQRGDALGLRMSEHVNAGRIIIQQVDPGELSPGELAFQTMERVQKDGVRLVVIDTINGYLHSMPEERFLHIQLHELLSFLGQTGVTTMMVMAQSGVVGTVQSPIDISYIADNVMMLRYFEAQGRIRKAISVLKKRSGRHEDTIRELTFEPGGITVGEPLADFQGVLTGAPRFFGETARLSHKS